MSSDRAEQWRVASRAAVPPFHVMDLLSAAAERRRTHGDLVDLVAGQPSTAAPRPVTAEAVRLLQSGDPLGYTVASGVPELREAIAGHHARTDGITVSPEDVVVTTGSSGGFLLAFLACFEPGDRVAMARPGYPCYRNVLRALGCEVVELPCGPETRFQPTVSQLEQVPDLRGVVVASPANPTGTMLAPAELAELAGWCEQRGIQLVSDEIYHGIEYGGAPGGSTTAWASSREAIVFCSFSKYFSMTGWRIGWMLVPPRLRRAVDVLAGNFTICPPVLAQRAAVAAFTDEAYAELDGHVRRYATNRALLLTELPRLGLGRLAPADGAFYVYADVDHLTDDSLGFTHRLLAETGVALAPGVDFDTVDGTHAVRFSFAAATEEVERGLERLSRWPGLRG